MGRNENVFNCTNFIENRSNFIKGNCKINDMFSLFLLNIHSARDKADELLVLLSDLNMPSFVLLTEHWLKEDELYYLSEYKTVSRFCRVRGYGGTAILVHNCFLEKFDVESVNCYDFLQRAHEFEFSVAHVRKLNVFIICLYRPPLGNLEEFLNSLELLLSGFPISAKILLAGDLNIDFSSSDSREPRLLANLLTCFNLYIFVNEPTRITNHSATTIDYICSNIKETDLSYKVVSTGISDHEGLIATIILNQNVKKKEIKETRIFSTVNFRSFENAAASIDWESVIESANSMKAFQVTLQNIFNKSFPLRRVKTKKKKLWVTRGIKVSGRNLRSLHTIKKFLTSDWFDSYFVMYRKIYKKIIKLAKKTYYDDRVKAAGNASKEYWKIIGEMRGKPHKKNVNSNISPADLNNYYCTIASKLASGLKPTKDPLDFLSDFSHTEDFKLTPTNNDEVTKIMRDIRKQSSSGVDGLSLKVFKHLPDAAITALADCINKSFTSGVFPDCLKLAIIIPIFKGGNSEDPSAYRPIALLTTLSKIIEKIVKVRLVEYLRLSGILAPEQFGFREGKGCGDAIFSFLERLFLGLNDGERAAAVFCDFSKAFDCVNHEILLRKMRHYGVGGRELSWFESYLSGRSQFVRMPGGRESEKSNLPHGVPQGSVLGPILFLIYVNDLAALPVLGNFVMFADDATMLWKHKDEKILKQSVQGDLIIVKEWCDANSLVFNVSKTNILTFKCDLNSITLDGRTIDHKTAVRFLGVHIDSRLRFETHIEALNKHLSQGCYIVKSILHELGKHTARVAYYALMESHIRFGIAFWGFSTQASVRSVFVLQKRALRYLCRVGSRESCRPLFVREQILTVPCIFILEVASLIFGKFRDFSREDRYNFRNHTLPLPIPKLQLTKHSVIYEGIKIFNNLPNDIKSITGYRGFRVQLKRYLLDKAFYSLQEFYE